MKYWFCAIGALSCVVYMSADSTYQLNVGGNLGNPFHYAEVDTLYTRAMSDESVAAIGARWMNKLAQSGHARATDELTFATRELSLGLGYRRATDSIAYSGNIMWDWSSFSKRKNGHALTSAAGLVYGNYGLWGSYSLPLSKEQKTAYTKHTVERFGDATLARYFFEHQLAAHAGVLWVDKKAVFTTKMRYSADRIPVELNVRFDNLSQISRHYANRYTVGLRYQWSTIRRGDRKGLETFLYQPMDSFLRDPHLLGGSVAMHPSEQDVISFIGNFMDPSTPHSHVVIRDLPSQNDWDHPTMRALVASSDADKGEVLAIYPVELFRREGHARTWDHTYALTIYDMEMQRVDEFTGLPSKLSYDSSIALWNQHVEYDKEQSRWINKDEDGVFLPPPIGQFANEPDLDSKPNTQLLFPRIDQDKQGVGSVVYAFLVSTDSIKKGDELVWCYGPGYHREYQSGCSY